MIRNIERIGNFTSSKIGALVKEGRVKATFGAPALTYIEECNMSRRLGRSLTNEVNARPIAWGNCLESIAHRCLPFDYTLTSKESIVHPDFDYWSGSPDGEADDTVYDIKCPMTLKSFCQLVDPFYDGFTGMDCMAEIMANHPDAEKYYWQLVSNSILTGAKFAELIVFVPYFSELAEIKLIAMDEPKYTWINYADDDELPYLPDEGFYNNLTIIRFEVPESDKAKLTDCVERAGLMLRSR